MLMNLSIDCRRILIPNASRKTPLKKAPMRRALCHPKERSWRAVAFSEIYRLSVISLVSSNRGLTISADNATTKLTRSFNYKVSSHYYRGQLIHDHAISLHSERHRLIEPVSRLERPLEIVRTVFTITQVYMYSKKCRTCDLGNEEEQGNANGYAKASLFVESKRHHDSKYVMTRFEGKRMQR